MKKMLTALSVFLTGLALAQVESQVVGYNTVEIPAGQQYTMLGFNFNEVGDGEGVNIQDLLPDPINSGLTAGDQLMVWNGSTGYDSYTLRGLTGPAAKQNKWLDSATNVSDFKLTPGNAVWLNRAGSAANTVNIVLKGEVISSESVDRTIAVGFNMISSVYPEGITLNATEGSLGYIDWVAAGVSSGDTIQVWNGSTGYTTYTYRGSTGPAAKQNKWLDSATNVADYTIPMGAGVWYSAASPLVFVETTTL